MHLSRRFLADLKAVAPPLPANSLSPGFLQELAAADEAARETANRESPSNDELGFLAERFRRWRSQTEKDLKGLLRRLPEDDPLRCPISLFATMDYGRLETAHTWALAWLLDPTKEHGFGSKLLEALLVHVRRRHLPVQVHQVANERFIDLPGKSDVTGRIDVLSEGDWIDRDGRRIPWLLVIEAKIEASEGEEQLSRYEDWLDLYEDDREVLRVFLTPDGRSAETAEQEWFPLKFQELAEIFRTASDQLRDKPGYHFLRFYLAGVLRDVCRLAFPIRSETDDPYSVLNYLKRVLDH
jgi:hypothetical protein